MKSIDLNCDLGEGAGQDTDLMPLITSANIACGEHAGDAATMRATVALARRHGVAIGAHPGHADRENFGRRERALTPGEAADLVLAQIRRLQDIAAQAGAVVRHVKLHGALYNQVSRERTLAEAVAEAIGTLGLPRIIYTLSGSELERAVRRVPGLVAVPEVFADRTYRRDGALTPRNDPAALITDEAAAVAQVLRMINDGTVRASDGAEVPIKAGTLCLHGDGPRAVSLALRLRQELQQAGITLAAPEPC